MTPDGHSDGVSKPSRLWPWYVAQLKPNAEAIAKRNLLRQGLKVFAPFEEVTTRKANKLTEARRSLFPGYLFVSFDPRSVRWRTVNSTLGVNRLISFSENHPAQVPPALMLSLEKRCDASGKLLPPAMLEAGKIVRIVNQH